MEQLNKVGKKQPPGPWAGWWGCTCHSSVFCHVNASHLHIVVIPLLNQFVWRRKSFWWQKRGQQVLCWQCAVFLKVSGSHCCAGQLLGCCGFLCSFPRQKGPRDEVQGCSSAFLVTSSTSFCWLSRLSRGDALRSSCFLFQDSQKHVLKQLIGYLSCQIKPNVLTSGRVTV